MIKKVTQFFNKIRKNVVEYIITNRLFITYVITSLIGTMFVRKYTIGTFWALKPLLTDLGLILIIGAFGYLIKPKNQFKYYFIWTIIFSLTDIINSVYYLFFPSGFASFGDLSTVGQVETVTGSIFDKIRFVDIMYIAIPLIFFLVHKLLSRSTYYYFIDKIEKGKKMVASTIIAGALCLGYSFGVATGTDYSRLAKQWNRVYIVERFGIIMYQFNDLVQSLTPRISSLFGYDEALEKFNAYFSQKEAHKDNKYTGVLKGYNIIFVHMEGMQSFLMDEKFNGVEVTPNLNRLAQEGMFFENFFPQVSTGTSSDTEFSLLTGLLPAASGTVFVSYPDKTYFTIPKYLKQNGYFIFSMHGNLPTMWNRSKVHPNLGYDAMYFKESFTFNDNCKDENNLDCVNLGINDRLFFAQGLPMIEEIEKTHDNYMGTIITLSNHSPFYKAAARSNLDLSITYNVYNDLGEVIGTSSSDYLSSSAVGEYMKSANYADVALGDFLEYVNNSSEFDNTLFVFYGDHDAKLRQSEMNYLYNLNPMTGEVYSESDPNYQEYDSYSHELNKKTPLIMWSKNKNLKRIFKGTISYTMGMYDIAPTILNMYGIYNKYTVGSDIFNSKDDNIVVFPNGNVVTSKVYYNNATEEYKVLEKDTIIDEDYIKNLIATADERLEISNGIIVHNLLTTVNMNGE